MTIQEASMNKPDSRTGSRVIVATTAMLSFISFWRAAAIVLNDLASSAYYVGGISENAIGKSAPWFILGVMLFSIAVRSVWHFGECDWKIGSLVHPGRHAFLHRGKKRLY